MTIASEISRLQTDKEAMRQAIIDKWVDVDASVSFDDYAACISEIQSWWGGWAEILLVWWWGGWALWWNTAFNYKNTGWWGGGGWWIKYTTFTPEIWCSYTVNIWQWWAWWYVDNSSNFIEACNWWDTCFWAEVALWWWKWWIGCWWNWWSWGGWGWWNAAWLWTEWEWYNWWAGWGRAWWWGWWGGGCWCNAGFNDWGCWWSWFKTIFFWNEQNLWGGWGGWNRCWAGWWTFSWCWWWGWWWWFTYNYSYNYGWWNGVSWLVWVRYRTDWSSGINCATWWDCCYVCWERTIHCFTSNWTFTIVS